MKNELVAGAACQLKSANVRNVPLLHSNFFDHFCSNSSWRLLSAAGQSRRLAYAEGGSGNSSARGYEALAPGAGIRFHPAFHTEWRFAGCAAWLSRIREIFWTRPSQRQSGHGFHRQGLHQHCLWHHAPGISQPNARWLGYEGIYRKIFTRSVSAR